MKKIYFKKLRSYRPRVRSNSKNKEMKIKSKLESIKNNLK